MKKAVVTNWVWGECLKYLGRGNYVVFVKKPS